jgi:hypothetical protein
MICAKSGYNWPSGSEEEVENVKVYGRTDRWTDGRWTAGIRIAHLSFQLRRAKNYTARAHKQMHAIIVKIFQDDNSPL